MEIKRSDLKLDAFTMLACNFATIPSDKKIKSEALKEIPIDLDFDILTNKKNKSRVKIVLEFHSNEIERSEEHTSELQSHWYISYAVFCLKKKKKTIIIEKKKKN